jgi:hypothetical protein
LSAASVIQREVFHQLKMPAGDYSFYAARVENLFLSAELPALEEYGIPVQVGLKLQDRLILDQGLDQALTSLLKINLANTNLSTFERELVEDAKTAI